jgi:hypothetical protein
VGVNVTDPSKERLHSRTRPLDARGSEKLGRGGEVQLLVGQALEREAVQRAHALGQDGGAVLGRGVADVGGELPAGVQGIGRRM